MTIKKILKLNLKSSPNKLSNGQKVENINIMVIIYLQMGKKKYHMFVIQLIILSKKKQVEKIK